MTIKTTCIHPPIPTRCFDWSAIDADTYDGAPDSPNRNQIGYGATENDAIADLKAQLIPETFMTTELGHLVNDLVNAAHKCGAAEDSMNGEQYKVLWSAQVAAEKALLDYLDGRESTFMKPTEEGFGRLVSELIKRTHECALAPDGYGCDAYLVQVAAEKALLEYVEKRERELAKLREGVEKAVIKWNQEAFQTRPVRRGMEVAHFHAHADALTACAAELRALLK